MRGVLEHSNYREDPWGRLYGTLDTVATFVFTGTDNGGHCSIWGSWPNN